MTGAGVAVAVCRSRPLGHVQQFEVQEWYGAGTVEMQQLLQSGVWGSWRGVCERIAEGEASGKEHLLMSAVEMPSLRKHEGWDSRFRANLGGKAEPAPAVRWIKCPNF